MYYIMNKVKNHSNDVLDVFKIQYATLDHKK